MAVRFTPGFKYPYFTTGSALASVEPIYIFAWVEPNNRINGTIMAINRTIAQGFTDFEHFTWEMLADGTVKAAKIKIGTAGEAISSNTYSTSTTTWYPYFGGFATTTSREVNLSGTTVTNTTSVGALTVGDTQIGARVIGPNVFDTFRRFDGCMAYLAAWNTRPTDDEIARLMAATATPDMINAGSLLLYAPFVDAATATYTYLANGSRGPDLTLHIGGGDGGTITDCVGPTITIPAAGAWKPDIRHY